MPRQTITGSQKKLLDTNFLDLTGSSKLDYGPLSLDALSQTLTDIGIQFALNARKNLQNADRIASGSLADSIIPTQVEIMGNVYNLNINVAAYYDFVNKGVKGWANEKGGASPYQFKQLTGKSGKKNSLMFTAIKSWLLKEGMKGASKVNAHPKASIRDRKRANITDSTIAATFAITKSIKKKGLAPSNFWTKTTEETAQLLKEKLGEALKIDIITNLTNTNGN